MAMRCCFCPRQLEGGELELERSKQRESLKVKVRMNVNLRHLIDGLAMTDEVKMLVIRV